MENQEEILDVLTVFEKKPSRDIPPVLEDYLTNVAKTGKTLFPWNRLKPLFISKLEQVMEQLNKDMPYDHLPPFPNVENMKYEDMKKRIVEALQKFNGAPFTVQRICELVTEPTKHYTRSDKFLRGIEKNVMVVSTVDPYGRKIVSDSHRGSLVNGLDINGFNQQKADANDINDGQPFTPMPLTDWSNNSLASVWPLAMGNGTDITKPSFSEQPMCTCSPSAAGVNVNNEEHEINVSEEAEVKYTYNDTESAETSETNTEQKEVEDENVSEVNESGVTSDSAPSGNGSVELKQSDTAPDPDLTSGDSMPFSFETKQAEVDNEADSTEKLDFSSVTAETVEPDEAACSNTETDYVDSSDFDGPPEKRMKLTDTQEEVSTSHSVETSEDAGEKSEEESTEKEADDVPATTEQISDLPTAQEEGNECSKSDHESKHEPQPVSSEPDVVSSSGTSSEQGEKGSDKEINEEQKQDEPDNSGEHLENTARENVDSANSDIDSSESKTESADIETTNTVSDKDTNDSNEAVEVSVDTTTSTEDASSGSEAMETEAEDCHSTEGQEEITQSGDDKPDEPEPMEQE